MSNQVALSDTEQDAVWQEFDTRFCFRPSIHSIDWPGIREPVPSVTDDIAGVYDLEEQAYVAGLDDLERKLVAALRRVTAPGECIYFLDWQHSGALVDPHAWEPVTRRPDGRSPEEWFSPFIPNGDYWIFLARDFRFGYFGHPWEKTVCLWGEPFLRKVEGDPPILLNAVLRRDGKRVPRAW